MARVILDEAFVRVSLDSDQAERDARIIGRRVGQIFADAAQRAAKNIKIKGTIDLDEGDLRRKLDDLNARIAARLNVDRAEFAAQIEALSPVELEAKLNIDNAAFDAQIAALNPVDLTANLNIANGEFAAQVEALNPVDLDVNLNIDNAEFAAQVAALGPVEIDVNLNLDNAAFDGEAAALGPIDVDVNLHIDNAEFDAEIAAISPVEIDAILNINRADLRLQLAAISPVDLRANVDINEARIIAAIRRAVRAGSAAAGDIDVDVDSDSIRRNLSSAIIGALGTIGPGIFSAITGALGSIPGIATSLAGTMASALGPALSAVAAISTGLAIAGGLTVALGVAAAGVGAAFGLVATAVVALPGLIAGLAAPIAAVTLGMEGIKKAAKTLQPEFDKLKKGVEDAFERGLKPAFEALRPLVVQLQRNLVSVADALSGLAVPVAKFLGSTIGLKLVDEAFANITKAISSVGPSLQKLAGAFLVIAGTKGVFDPLTVGITQFADAFDGAIARLDKTGALTKTFTLLGEVVGELAKSFVALVEGGVNLFLGVGGPLVNLLAGISKGLKGIDFLAVGQKLGVVIEQFSTFAGRLSDDVGGVLGTLTELSTHLLQFFNKPLQTGEFEATFLNIKDSIKAVEQPIKDVTEAFLKLGSNTNLFDALTGGIQAFGREVRTSLNALTGDGTLNRGFEELRELLKSLAKAFVNIVENGFRLFTGAAPAVTSLIDSLGVFFGKFDWDRVGKAIGGIFEGLGHALEGVPQDLVDNIIKTLEELAKTANDPSIQKIFQDLFAVINDLVPVVAKLVVAFLRTAAVLIGLAKILIGVGDAFVALFQLLTGQISFGQFTKQMADAGGEIIQGGQYITDAFARIGEEGAAAAIIAHNKIAQATLDAGKQVGINIKSTVDEWVLSAKNGAQSTGEALKPGDKDFEAPAMWASLIQQIASAVFTSGQTVATNVTTTVNDWVARVQGGTALIPGAAAAGVAPTPEVVAGALAPVGGAVSTAFGQAIINAQTAAGQIPGVTQAGMAPTPAVVSGILGQIGLAVQGAFGQAVTNAQTGAAQVAASANGMQPAVGTTQTIFSQLPTIVSGAMGQVKGNVATGASDAVNAVAPMNQMPSRVDSALNPIPPSVQRTFGGVTSAVQTGVNNAVAAVGPLVGRMRAAIPENGLYGAGQALGRGLQNGINSVAGAVAAAAASVAAKAIAAARAAAGVHSPSRLMMELGDFMGQGLEIGLIQSARTVAQAAATMVDSAVDEAGTLGSSISAALSPDDPTSEYATLGDRIGQALADAFTARVADAGDTTKLLLDRLRTDAETAIQRLLADLPDTSVTASVQGGTTGAAPVTVVQGSSDALIAELRQLRVELARRDTAGGTTVIDVDVAAEVREVGAELNQKLRTLSQLGSFSR